MHLGARGKDLGVHINSVHGLYPTITISGRRRLIETWPDTSIVLGMREQIAGYMCISVRLYVQGRV